MTTFYLLRHGDKEFMPGNPPLSSQGTKQAEATAKYLQNKNITAIFTSKLKRAQDTAQIISQVLNLPMYVDERLKERMNWGDKEGQSFEEFNVEWRKTDKDRNYKPTPGNSSFETGNNLKLFLDEISKKYNNQTILVITHGGTIGDFLRNVFKEEDLPFAVNKETNVRYMEILECSITVVEEENSKYILKTINSLNHLRDI